MSLSPTSSRAAVAPLALTGVTDAVQLRVRAAPGQVATSIVQVQDDDGTNLFGIDPSSAGDVAFVRANEPTDTVLALFAETGQVANILEAGDLAGITTSGFDRAAYIYTKKIAAPADATLDNSQVTLWLDATPGVTKLMVKAKDSAGTVRTAAIVLT